MPKVSVIVPNYNHAHYLEQRLASILNQTFTDFELIFLDDCSQDNSVSVAETFRHDPRFVHLEVNERNSGSTFIQWEKGISLAKGEYLWLAESDDTAEPGFLAAMVKALDQNKDYDVAYTSSIWIDDKDQEIHRPPHEKGDAYLQGKYLVQKEFLQGPVIYNASSAVFRKPNYIDFNLLKTFKYTGDWLFWVMMAGPSGIIRLDLRHNRFRRHENNVSFRSEREGLLFSEGFRVMDYIYSHYPVSWWNKRINALRWAKRIGDFREGIPAEVRFYNRFLK